MGTDSVQRSAPSPTQAVVVPMRRGRERNGLWMVHWAVLLAYLLLTLLMTWPLAKQWTTAIPGDGFDGWQNYWNQWWIKVALVERLQSPFHTDLLYYPTGVDLYFHTLNPFNGVTTLPIQLSFGLIPAYNSVVLISWILAGYGTYLLVRWLLRTQLTAQQGTPLVIICHLAALIAGVIFTFAPFHMAHLLGHMQVMSLEWIPFYILYLLRAIYQQRQEERWWRSAALAGLFLTLTGLCDWYFVLYLFFFTGLVLLNEIIRCRGSLIRRFGVLWPAILAGAIMVFLLSPLLLPMTRAANQFSFMVRPTSDLYILSASVLDFFVPNRLHAFFRPTSFSWPGNQIAPVSERTISIGYLALGLAVIALWSSYRRSQAITTKAMASFWFVCALFFFVLALGPSWHFGNITAEMIPEASIPSRSWTPFGLLNRTIPFMRISRSVSRYALMVQLSVAVLAGIGSFQLVKSVQRRPPAGAQRSPISIATFLTTTLLLAVVLFESWVAPFPMSPPDTPPIYGRLTEIMPELGVEDAILNLPMNYDRPGYLLYQTVHEQPLAIAYISRDDPRTLTERVTLLQHLRHLGPDIIEGDATTAGFTVLNDLGIGAVILDRYKMPGGKEREYTEEIANALFAGQKSRYEDDRLTIYAVPTVAKAEPYLMLGPLHWGPLQTTPETNRRLIGPMGASLLIQHADVGAELQIQYRSTTDDALEIYLPMQSTPWQSLPAAPTGKRIELSVSDISEIILRSTTPNGVWIEGVLLYCDCD